MFDQIYITGFGKFGHHQVNPTQLIMNHLQKNPMPNVYPAVLQVTTECVDKYLDSFHKEKQKGNNLQLHLGVGPNLQYQLQTCGYNNKDFGIPDNSGQTFHKCKITNEFQLDEPIFCKLKLEKLRAAIKRHGVSMSNDPGRYLCNYIYFSSLRRNNPECCSLFVHIPTQKHRSHQQNMEFITDLISELLKKE